jgi:hypothetical protein
MELYCKKRTCWGTLSRPQLREFPPPPVLLSLPLLPLLPARYLLQTIQELVRIKKNSTDFYHLNQCWGSVGSVGMFLGLPDPDLLVTQKY